MHELFQRTKDELSRRMFLRRAERLRRRARRREDRSLSRLAQGRR